MLGSDHDHRGGPQAIPDPERQLPEAVSVQALDRVDQERDIADLLRLPCHLGGRLAAPLAPYRIELGFPTPVDAAFALEAQVKSEDLELVQRKRTTSLMERRGPTTWARNDDGQRIVAEDEMLASETALSNLRGSYREIDSVRHFITSWRFYHAFRTDADSPLRRPSRAITAEQTMASMT